MTSSKFPCHKTPHSDSTLMGMSKRELISLIRDYEDSYNRLFRAWKQHVKNAETLLESIDGPPDRRDEELFAQSVYSREQWEWAFERYMDEDISVRALCDFLSVSKTTVNAAFKSLGAAGKHVHYRHWHKEYLESIKNTFPEDERRKE